MNEEENKEITVFITRGDVTCEECGEELGRHAWITLDKERRALCLTCSDLDHLAFLHSGDACVTRRAKKGSTLWAVVVEWSRTRKRYERQGLLIEEDALARAEQECLADADARERRQERETERRAELDREYVERFATRVRELYPKCPAGRETAIAEHACQNYSGRVGRSAAAKTLDDEAVRLAVKAHVRHAETKYDSLLAAGWDRRDARGEIEDTVQHELERWRGKDSE